MGMTILKKKTGYALGVLLIIIGVLMLLVVMWRWQAEGVFSSSDVLSSIMDLWGNEFPVGLGLTILVYTVLGLIFLGVGAVILVARRERVTVTEEQTVLLECPHCKNQWRESMSKAHLKSMGYPNVKTISRRKCSKCAKFIRPKIVTTKA